LLKPVDGVAAPEEWSNSFSSSREFQGASL
jgi:hypothetical protein